MKGTLRTLLLSVFVLSTLSLSFGQDHLLITEFANTPSAGEFVEIHNPTADSVDLTNYYLTDATFAGGGTYYYNIVTGSNAGGGGFGDWNARFPAGAKIGPGEYQTVAMLGDSLFFEQYGVAPTYELYEDGSNFANDVPDMLEATAGSIDNDHAANQNFGVLSSGEVLIMYYWDGASDLVMDVDYVVWQDKAEAVDKTGVSVDGPDADAVASTYADDTPIADQTSVNADGDDDSSPHDSGGSAQRKLPVEDLEEWTGGNGMTGHNEMSENTSYKGGIWSYDGTPTPNASALGDGASFASINFVRSADIGDDALDNSPINGDTVTVTGIITNGLRDIDLGARWGAFMQGLDGGPWSGGFVIQHDTTVTATLLTSAQVGDTIRVTGNIAEFPTTAMTPSGTQVELLLNPVTPIEYIGFGDGTVADTTVLVPADLGIRPGVLSADPQIAERWESMLVRFNNLTVTGNGLPDNTMTAADGDGNTIVLDDYFQAVDDAVTSNGASWPGFPAGTLIDVTGYIRGASTGGFMTVNPRTIADVEIGAIPPNIANLTRSPVIPTSSESPEISAVITEPSVAVASANLYYRVDGGAFTMMAMAATDSLYAASIPAQANGAFVEYYITSVDAEGDSTSAPANVSAGAFFYFVRDGGATIADVQFTPFADGVSSLVGLEVTVTGVATTDSADFSYYYLQDGTEPWSGVWVNDNITNVKIGDQVQVTGTVQENFGATRINNITSANILSSGNAVPDPIDVMTGDVNTGGALAEQYESMLIRVRDVAVINELPDGANFGEFTVDDGSGELRVDDVAAAFGGQLPDTAFTAGDSLESITAVHYYSFSNFKLAPRNDGDVVRKITTAVDELLGPPTSYELKQNYPNPFNPETTIKYSLPQKGAVTLTIYNIMGQKIKSLVNKEQPAGRYEARWNGLNDQGFRVASGIYFYRIQAGDFSKLHKMLLLK